MLVCCSIIPWGQRLLPNVPRPFKERVTLVVGTLLSFWQSYVRILDTEEITEETPLDASIQTNALCKNIIHLRLFNILWCHVLLLCVSGARPSRVIIPSIRWTT